MAKKQTQALTPEERLEQALVPEDERPYELPNGWKWVRLNGMVETIKEKTDIFDDPDIRYVGLENIENSNGISGFQNAQAVKSTKSVFRKGDILYGKLRPYLNKHGIADFDGVCSTDIMVLRPFYFIDSRYINYYLDMPSFIRYAVSESKGINLPRVSPTAIEEAVIPLPEIKTQKKIADILDREFSRLDEAKEQVQSVLDSSEERKQSILHKAFTGELTEKWRSKTGHKLEEWKTLNLDDCGEWYGGGTPSKSHPAYYEDADLLWITSKDMKADFIDDTQIKINQLGVDNSSANLIKDPAVLFVMRSGILRRTAPIALVKIPFTVNQDLKALVVHEGIIPEYALYACKAQEQGILNTCMKSGTTVESLEFSRLKKLKICIPSIEEQDEIVRIVMELLQKDGAINEAADTTIDQIDGTKRALLSKAFHGDLSL